MAIKKEAICWALYDWANSAYTTTVMAGFFPVFFKDYWSGAKATESTFWLGLSVSAASLVIALAAPVLGAMADRGSARKRTLLCFASLGIIGTAGLFFIARGEWQWAASVYVLSSIGFLGANIFYDSLLVSVSDQDVDYVSALGFALGYLGGGILFAVNVLMVQKPLLFGLSSAADAVRLSFLTVAVWWGIFTVPLALYVPEPEEGEPVTVSQAFKMGFRQLRETLGEIRRMQVITRFLLAYWLYIDGVHTMITMSVDYGKNIGLGTSELITGLLMVQFVGFPGSYLTGWLGRRYGAKRIVIFCILVYLVVTVMASQMQTEPYRIWGWEMSRFYSLAFLIGLVQGGVQSLSRSLYSRLVPESKEAEFFGFYNMLGKFASIFGPVLMGVVARLTGSPRYGVLSISILFISGAWALWQVDEREGERIAPML